MKKTLSYLLFFIFSFFIAFNIKALELEDLKSKNIVLYNLNDDNIIYKKGSDKQISIASLTKMMTVLIGIEKNPNLDKKVIVSHSAFQNTSQLAMAGFKIGDEVTIRDLLYGAMLPSGADAVNQIAITSAGNVGNFVKLMNEKATELNLKHTHFVNATGMDANEHYSSVEDVASILKYALNNKEFKKIFTTKDYVTTNNLNLKSSLKKTSENNGLNTDFINGSKTGYTDDAGLCMASISTLNDVNYLLVTAGAPPKTPTPFHVTEAITIYNYYNDNYEYKTLVKKAQILKTIYIKNGKEEKYNIKSVKTIKKYLPKDIKKSDIKIVYNGINEIDRKIKKGSKLGTIKVSYKSELIDEFSVYLDKELKYKILTLPIIVLLISLIVIGLLLINLFVFSKNKVFKK